MAATAVTEGLGFEINKATHPGDFSSGLREVIVFMKAPPPSTARPSRRPISLPRDPDYGAYYRPPRRGRG